MCHLQQPLSVTHDYLRVWIIGGLVALLSLLFLSAHGEESKAAAVDLLSADFANSEPGEHGIRFTFDMGTRRVNWNHARWSHINFAETGDWSAYRGLRIRVHSEHLRSDASVALALREDDGSWHYVAAACDLVQEDN
ncbi:MAG: hypothetical protein EA401_10440, partial [Planctomycetota bacterium]